MEPFLPLATKRTSWLRRHPRWTALGLVTVLAVLACAAVFLWIVLPLGSHFVERPTALPVSYDEDRFFVVPEVADGAKLRLLADTGGGLFVTRAAAKRCGLVPSWSFGRGSVVRLHPLRTDAWIPEPVGAECWIPLKETEGDGMLGQRWFAGGIWTFDFPQKKLILNTAPLRPTARQFAHSVLFGFPTFLGIRSGNHPRFAVTIDGRKLESLFDTGATLRLTNEAAQQLGDGHARERATCFVAASVFDRWRTDHPNWRMVENAEVNTKLAIIEVPKIEVAGFEVGPAWFTRRPDAAHQWMSTFMDQPIVASIGGNVLRHFRVTIDYPAAIAYFERETD